MSRRLINVLDKGGGHKKDKYQRPKTIHWLEWRTPHNVVNGVLIYRQANREISLGMWNWNVESGQWNVELKWDLATQQVKVPLVC